MGRLTVKQGESISNPRQHNTANARAAMCVADWTTKSPSCLHASRPATKVVHGRRRGKPVGDGMMLYGVEAALSWDALMVAKTRDSTARIALVATASTGTAKRSQLGVRPGAKVLRASTAWSEMRGQHWKIGPAAAASLGPIGDTRRQLWETHDSEQEQGADPLHCHPN